MTTTIHNRNVSTISSLMPLDLKAELFERIMGDEHRLDWRCLLRRWDERLKRLYNQVLE
jgi:hypothetical protein